METLLMVLIGLLLILNIILVAALFIAYRFFRELRAFMESLHYDIDKLRSDYDVVKTKLKGKSSLFMLMLGLVGRRRALKTAAEMLVGGRHHNRS
jgi:hypothetical protein